MNKHDAKFFAAPPPAPIKLRRRVIGAVVHYGPMFLGAAIVGAALGRALFIEANLPL